MSGRYVHGYGEREARRLGDQAGTLADLLHHDTRYPEGASVLEVGCGVGAQTVILAAASPGALITSVDISAESLREAAARCRSEGIRNVTFERRDVYRLEQPDAVFDHGFVCFVLEHLADPVAALREMFRVIRPGGTLTVIEGDHGSALFHPPSDDADTAIACQVVLQARAGGNANIGRQLFPLVSAAGGVDVRVSPRLVYADASRPEWVEGFTRNTFTAMIAGVREAAVQARLVDPDTFDRGIRDLERTTAPDGVFTYLFFKAVARRP